jgi:hypothetical protein
LEYFPSAEEKARQAAADLERETAAAERERKMLAWLAEDLAKAKSSRPDWRDDEAG